MNATTPSLTYAILMYNEELNIRRAVDEAVRFLEGHLEDWEIVAVDDGSADGSAAVVEELAAADPRIRLERHLENRGMGAGIATAIRAAAKDVFTFNAADGQIPADQLARMLPGLDGADMVLTVYEGGREDMVRAVVSKLFRLFLLAAAGMRFRHEGIYLFPTAHAKRLADEIEARTFFFSFALIQKGLDAGLTANTARIICAPRASGRSKVLNFRRIGKVAREVLRYGRARGSQRGA